MSSDVMTLEQIREAVDVCDCNPGESIPVRVEDMEVWRRSIDAAIRERDELRDRLDGALGDRIREFRRANDESRRAEKAETELAALKKKVADATVCELSYNFHTTLTRAICSVDVPESLIRKRVRLVVDDDV